MAIFDTIPTNKIKLKEEQLRSILKI